MLHNSQSIGIVPMNQPNNQPNQPNNQPNQAAQPEAPQHSPAKNLSSNELARFVTTIKNVEQQIGEHVIRALQHADTVAVLTTVVVGPGGQQHIVSAALNEEKTAQVNALLTEAREVYDQEEPCFGFHCLLDPKDKTTKKAQQQAEGTQEDSLDK